MIILQRWEPIVADNFPSIIAFWIRIHGIPLHYWTKEALEAIGSELGHVDSKDVPNRRVRVFINGLRSLERHLEISLPSGEIKEVELEYEKLEKHCFSCLSLSHEQDQCPSRSSSTQPPVGINQARTLEKLAERRRLEGKGVRTDARPFKSVRHYDSSSQHRSGYNKEDQRIRHPQPSEERGYRPGY